MAKDGWEWLVGLATIVLLVIFICKILFWISLLAFGVGLIWVLIIAFITKDTDDINIPLIIIGVSLVVGFITFGIGYQFEKSELGKPFVDVFKTVLEVDNNINNIPIQVNNQLNNSIKQST